MHVFADLEPYICTFPNCDHELVQFPTRAAWADHEFSCHRFETRWNCPECGSEEPSLQDWERHIQEHSLGFTGPEFQVARTIARNKKARPIENEECLLCRESPAQNRRAFITHVGRHMEEMALVVLPRDTEDDSEGLSDLSSQGSDATEQLVSRKDIQVDGEMKQVESTREITPSFRTVKPFDGMLEKTRPFICIFELYGCRQKFARSFDWKRHINESHLQLKVWRCDLDTCSERILDSASKASYRDFRRRLAFIAHVKKGHAPQVSASHAEKAAFEAHIPAIEERCLRRRSPPPRSRCLYCSDKVFEGPGSWTERQNHVAEHLENNDVATDDDVEDTDLKEWMMANGLMEREAHTG